MNFLKNKQIRWYLLLILISVVTVYLLITKNTGTIKDEIAYFSLTNTSGITAFQLADNKNNQVLVYRKGNNWILNDSLPASNESVFVFLELLKRLEISAPASKEVVKELNSGDARRIEVRLFEGNTQTHKFYLAEHGDENHIYISSTSASRPYQLGFKGRDLPFALSAFSTKTSYWQSNILLDIAADEIQNIQLVYPTQIHESFEIFRQKNAQLSLKSLKNKEQKFDSTQEELNSYFHYFSGLTYKHLYKASEIQLQIDKPSFILKITGLEDEIVLLEGYPKLTLKNNDSEGMKLDMHSFYAIKNRNGNVVYEVSYENFDAILKRLSDFMNS